MSFDALSGWEVVAQAAFVVTGSAMTWDDDKWDEATWNATGADSEWSDLSCSTLTASGRFGASSSAGVLTRYESATLELDLADADRLLDPFNPEGYARFGRLQPRAGIRLRARHESEPAVWHELFTGFLESLAYEYADKRCRIVASDAVSYLQKYDPPPSEPPIGAGDTASQRVTRLLDLAAWPVGLRDVAAGGSTLTATELDGSTWEELLLVAEADFALLTIAPTGIVTFRPRSALPWATTLSASVGNGSGIPVVSSAAQDDDANLINSVTAARVDGLQYTKDDPVSAALYGFAGQPVYYKHSQTDLPLANDVDVIAWRDAVLSVHAYPKPRLSPIVVELAYAGVLVSDALDWKAIARLRIGQRWHVRCDPLSVDEDQHVRGWTFALAHDSLSLTWSTALVTTSAYWSTPMIWNDSTYGRWDEFTWG